MPKKRSRIVSSSESDDDLPLADLKENKMSTENNSSHETSSESEENDEILKSHKKRIKNLVDSDSDSSDDIKKKKKNSSTEDLESIKKSNHQIIERILHENSDEELEELTSFQSKPNLNTTTGSTSFMSVQQDHSPKENKDSLNDVSDGNLMDYFDKKYNTIEKPKPEPLPRKSSKFDLRKSFEPRNSYGSGWSYNYRKTGARDLLTFEDLEYDTKKAKHLEVGRKLRLEKKQEMLKKRFPNQNDFDEVLLDYDTTRNMKIVVDHRIVLKMKQHQIEAVKFLYDNVFGSVNDLNEDNMGSGCILAHCMGLGKTLSTIALIATVARYHHLGTKRILILCPKSTILNWRDEFIRWVGSILTINLFNLEDGMSLDQRVSTLENWMSRTYYDPGVLLLGYEAFRNLVFVDTMEEY